MQELTVFIEPYTINTLETSDITCSVNLPKFLYAPLNKGDILGSVVYKKGDMILGEAKLVSTKDIAVKEKEPKIIEKLFERIKYILINI